MKIKLSGKGIREQIEESSKNTFEHLTTEGLTEILEDMLIQGRNPSCSKSPELVERLYGEKESKGISLDNIPDGYLFSIGNIITGSGEVRDYIATCRETGIEDNIIKSCIKMTLDDGIKTNTEFYNLHRFIQDEGETS